MPASVHGKVDVHADKRESPQQTGKPKCPCHGRVHLGGWNAEFIEDGENQQDGEVAGQKVCLPQQMDDGDIAQPWKQTPATKTKIDRHLPCCESCIECSPHVSQTLSIASKERLYLAPPAAALVARHIALTRRHGDHARNDVSLRAKITLEQHVQVFADRRWVAIPPANSFHQRERQRINRRRKRQPRARIHGRQACEPPEKIGASHQHGRIVRIAVEDDRTAIKRTVSFAKMVRVQSLDLGKIILGQVTISCGRQMC